MCLLFCLKLSFLFTELRNFAVKILDLLIQLRDLLLQVLDFFFEALVLLDLQLMRVLFCDELLHLVLEPLVKLLEIFRLLLEKHVEVVAICRHDAQLFSEVVPLGLELLDALPVNMRAHPQLLILHLMLLDFEGKALLGFFRRLTHLGYVGSIRLILSLEQLLLSEDLTFELLVFGLDQRVLLLHLVMALLKALLDALQRLSNRPLVLILQRHLLHVAAQLHEVRMSLDVSLLLLFVAVDPDFAGVFLSRDELCLLVDLVEQLLSLDVVLLFKGLLLDLERVGLALNLSELLLLFVILPLVGLEHLVALSISFADLLKLLVQLVEIVLSLLPHFIRLLEMRVRVFEVVF